MTERESRRLFINYQSRVFVGLLQRRYPVEKAYTALDDVLCEPTWQEAEESLCWLAHREGLDELLNTYCAA